jgi:hypothetical protein
MLASQSKTVSFPQFPVEQSPLLPHPLGNPFIVEEQVVQLIYYYLFIIDKIDVNFTFIFQAGKYTQY